MITNDLAAAGRISGRQLKGGRIKRGGKTLFEQFVAVLASQGKNWLGNCSLPDEVACDLFQQLAESVTIQENLLQEVQLTQLAQEVKLIDQGERLVHCEEQVAKLKQADGKQLDMLQAAALEYARA